MAEHLLDVPRVKERLRAQQQRMTGWTDEEVDAWLARPAAERDAWEAEARRAIAEAYSEDRA